MPRVQVKSYKVEKRKIKTLTHRHREKLHDELKWWRVVRYWAKRKYGLSMEDLETILFLYTEPLFTRKGFREFDGVLSWDKFRFNGLIDKGLIVLWRDHKGYTQIGKRYTLSFEAKRICASVYKKLHQEEHIPENHLNNPIFKGDNYTDKKYRKIIKMMNKKKEEESSKK